VLGYFQRPLRGRKSAKLEVRARNRSVTGNRLATSISTTSRFARLTAGDQRQHGQPITGYQQSLVIGLWSAVDQYHMNVLGRDTELSEGLADRRSIGDLQPLQGYPGGLQRP